MNGKELQISALVEFPHIAGIIDDVKELINDLDLETYDDRISEKKVIIKGRDVKKVHVRDLSKDEISNKIKESGFLPVVAFSIAILGRVAKDAMPQDQLTKYLEKKEWFDAKAFKRLFEPVQGIQRQLTVCRESMLKCVSLSEMDEGFEGNPLLAYVAKHAASVLTSLCPSVKKPVKKPEDKSDK